MSDLKILIIEDDLIYATKLSHWLDSTSKNVFVATSAEEGSQIASKITPDIIFLDNVLPGVNGKDSIEIFKKVICPNAYVVLMSAEYKINDVATGIQNGADHLFDKNDFDLGSLNELLIGIENSKKHKESLWRYLDVFKSKKSSKYINNIAIIDDDDLFTFHLNWYLSENTNHNIINTFSTAENFYNHYKNEKPQLIFLDYFLPDSNGEEVMKKIVTNFPDSEVIMVSSQDDPKIALLINKLGIKTYIIKDKKWKEEVKKVVSELKVI